MSKKILLGVSGGIAAYKAAEIVRAFVKRGDEVRVVMTSGAQEFLSPLTLQVLSGNLVGTEIFDATYESEIGHIDLARWPDVILCAPATANLIGRLANGLADDLLTTVICATTAPVVVAPAMNTQMFRNPLVQQNLKTLREIAGYTIVDPDTGELACKEVGPGRLPDPPVLLDVVDGAGMAPRLAGKRVLVTAGPTREHVDPARFLSNPSTGRMGFALARVARQMGAEVTLVAGPVELQTPYGVRRIGVVSARQMYDAVMDEVAEQDVIVKAAAVADWRPKEAADRKRTKGEMTGTLALERNPDILAELGERFGDGRVPFLVGFAAESHDVEARGAAKRERKGAHLLVANPIGGDDDSFGAEITAVAYLIDEEGSERVEAISKEALAARIWAKVAEAIGGS